MSTPNEQDRPPGANGAPAGEGGEVDLQAALQAAEVRALESRDLYMRALAEMENIRKRASRDVEQAHKYAVDKFANDLVAVKDSLELGLLAAGDAQTLRAGTEATLKLLAKPWPCSPRPSMFPTASPRSCRRVMR
jgi:molecular chaperone GrpE